MPSRILIVDDDPVVCELIQEVFSSPEMESFSLTNSSHAVTHLSHENSARFSSMCACRRRTASN
jgi:DNA-binding response OmpR family regulator